MAGPTREFWQEKFLAHETKWDRGEPNPQLARWLASGALAPCRILVPGCGSGHEVVALARNGFTVTALDYAPAAIALTRERLERADARATVIETDVLDWPAPARFDAIYEQTCLCALHPDHWELYAERLDAWLAPGGRLFALLMQAPRTGAADGRIDGPPYHCDVNAVRALLPEPAWTWPAPAYARVAHSGGWVELAVVIEHSGPA
ncbi:MAG TPA: methyltransferase domain-containing protein [Casimicrobiaceae bacterium]|nr:methyltransferase domain-containing protein [Casimicrobiaceae bacterium]